jgi:hypothetical protein
VNVVGGIFVGRADELSLPETAAAAAACRGQPQVVLVLVDDLQWTDRASARALPFAVRPVAGRPDAGCGVSPPGELARLGEAAGPSPAARKLTSPAAERHLLCMSSRRKEKLMGEQPSATPDPAITPADSLAAPADSLTDLRGQMTVMKGEIDALKIASAQAGKPWYRQASVIIAVAALLFSMVSTYYADHLTTEQSKVASRSELGQLIQLLSALPEKDTELAAKYAGAPTTMISLRGDLAAESLVLAQHAADIIDRIPDQVSVTEYLSVAYPLV